MGDLWQRFQDVKTLIESAETQKGIIRDALEGKTPWGFCCLHITKDGDWQCSRYKLPEEEFRKKCEECKKEIKEFLKNLADEDKSHNKP